MSWYDLFQSVCLLTSFVYHVIIQYGLLILLQTSRSQCIHIQAQNTHTHPLMREHTDPCDCNEVMAELLRWRPSISRRAGKQHSDSDLRPVNTIYVVAVVVEWYVCEALHAKINNEYMHKYNIHNINIEYNTIIKLLLCQSWQNFIFIV